MNADKHEIDIGKSMQELIDELKEAHRTGRTEINGYLIDYKSKAWGMVYTFLKATDGRCTREQLINSFPNISEKGVDMAIKDYFYWFDRLDDDYICKSRNYTNNH